MNNEFPIMPLRAMYADKSTEGKDLNKVGSIEPVVISDDEFTRELLQKAVEVGAFVYDGRVWYVGTVVRSGEGIDVYASTPTDDEFTVRIINVYTEDDPNTITVDMFSRVVPTHAGTRLYKHSIKFTVNYGGGYIEWINTTEGQQFINASAATVVSQAFNIVHNSIKANVRGSGSYGGSLMLTNIMSKTQNNKTLIYPFYVVVGGTSGTELVVSNGASFTQDADPDTFTDTVTEL